MHTKVYTLSWKIFIVKIYFGGMTTAKIKNTNIDLHNKPFERLILMHGYDPEILLTRKFDMKISQITVHAYIHVITLHLPS